MAVNFVIKVYITEYKNNVFEQGVTVTEFPASPTQMSDIYEFLKGIYDEFRRQGLYESSVLLFLQKWRTYGEASYDYTDDAAEDHLFQNGPLPGDYVFSNLEDNIKHNRVGRGYRLFLTDVCEGTNIYNQWVLILEIV
jgi:hypothetical protein